MALAFSLGATSGFSWPGDLDPTFGNRGKVVSDLGALEEANAAVLQADGRIVVAGRSGSWEATFSNPSENDEKRFTARSD